MSDKLLNRRDVLNAALAAGVVSALHGAPAQAMASKLNPSDPIAKSVGYVEDASKVDGKKFPSYKPGQACSNCSLILLHYGFYRPCKLFPKNVVNAKGWCSGWTQNPNK